MNSVYVIKWVKFIVNTQNDLLTAPEWHILLHILVLAQIFIEVLCDILLSHFCSVCFRNDRGPNLRDFRHRDCTAFKLGREMHAIISVLSELFFLIAS